MFKKILMWMFVIFYTVPGTALADVVVGRIIDQEDGPPALRLTNLSGHTVKCLFDIYYSTQDGVQGAACNNEGHYCGYNNFILPYSTKNFPITLGGDYQDINVTGWQIDCKRH